MTRNHVSQLLGLVLLIGLPTIGRLYAQTKTLGVIVNYPGSNPGYNLFTPLRSKKTFLIDQEGNLVHQWETPYEPGNMQYLREDGHLIRTGDPKGNTTFVAGGDAGIIQEYDWDGNLVWEYLYSDNTHRAHHDIAVLPNGNILMIAWEYKTLAECLDAGRNPNLLTENTLWPEHIIELEPVGTNQANIVWKWHVWDHLIQDFDASKANYGVVANHPELIDVNFNRDPKADWIHANAIDYNPALDQILLSSPAFGEVWIIDHSTTTAEAAGHTGGLSGRGGDLLYRWGNPRTYRAGNDTDQIFYWPHGAHWIPPGLAGAGNLLVFNNGNGRSGLQYSSVEEVVPTLDGSNNYVTPIAGIPFGPAAARWSYTASPPESMYSAGLSNAQRLPNGNTLICIGVKGTFVEITPTGEKVWEYASPITEGTIHSTQGTPLSSNNIFRVTRYPLDYPAFTGRQLTSYGPLEIPAQQIFQIKDLSRVEDGWQVTWHTLPGNVYRLEYSESIDKTIWQPVSTLTAPATLLTVLDTNPAHNSPSRGFYRVVRLP
jgi:hypothetical protein